MWFIIQNQQVRINILAKPHAKKTALVKISDQGLHIALHAKPFSGAANTELIAYLVKLLHLPKSQIVLQRGESTRYKQIIVPMTDIVLQLLKDPVSFLISPIR